MSALNAPRPLAGGWRGQPPPIAAKVAPDGVTNDVTTRRIVTSDMVSPAQCSTSERDR